MLRCDQSTATGFAPEELMLGRALVYPIQFSREDIDLSGTLMTVSLVQKLKQIRENNFSKASKQYQKHRGDIRKVMIKN